MGEAKRKRARAQWALGEIRKLRDGLAKTRANPDLPHRVAHPLTGEVIDILDGETERMLDAMEQVASAALNPRQAANRREEQRQRFVDGIKQIHTEGQGLWDLWIFPANLFEEPAADEETRHLQTVALRFVANAYEARAGAAPVLCLLCDHSFTAECGGPAGIVVLAPKVDAPSRAIVNALCARCFGGGEPELKERVFAAYRDTLMGGEARILTTPAAPGHA